LATDDAYVTSSDPTANFGDAAGMTPLLRMYTLGHEFAGTVEAVGQGVSGVRVGDRIAPEVVLFCGVCFFCRRHEYALCVNWAALGLMADGGLAEFAVVPAATIARQADVGKSSVKRPD